MTNSRSTATSGYDKGTKFGQLFIQLINLALDAFHIFRVRILAAFSCVFSWSVARCEPIENSLCCILRIKSRSASSSKYVFSHPRWELSSSIVPYASKRIWVFGTRLPPTRLVVPLSPVFVYTRLFHKRLFFIITIYKINV